MSEYGIFSLACFAGVLATLVWSPLRTPLGEWQSFAAIGCFLLAGILLAILAVASEVRKIRHL